MRHHPSKRFLAVCFTAALALGAVACSDDDGDDVSSGGTDAAITGLADLAEGTIGVQTNTTGEEYANANAPEGAEVKSFVDTSGLFAALESGDIDAVLQDLPVNAERALADDTLEVIETYDTDESYGFAVATGSDLKAELDTALAAVRDDGTYDAIYAKYFPEPGEEPGAGPDASDVEGTRTLKVCSDIPYPPMEMEGEGPRGLEYTGFDIDLLDAMAVTMDANLEILVTPFDSIFASLAAGNCDVVASSVTINDEREEQMDFTEPYFEAEQSLLVKVG